jgi:2-methylcitrate dehydratase PrpD
MTAHPLAAIVARAASPAPPEVSARARLLTLDTIGCLIAGLGHGPVVAYATALATAFPGTFRWPGAPVGLSPAGAATLGATAACWDEACEGLASAHGRPGLPLVPALLATAGAASLGELLAALTLGYEIGGRIGAAWRIRPGMHVDGGWHATGVAAGCAALAGGDPLAAVDIALCQVPASLYLPIAQGSVARNSYPGHAALLGLMAAAAGAAGMPAPSGALREGRRVVLGLDDAAEIVGTDRWLITEGYLKPFAAVRHVHYGAAAALALRSEIGDPAAITGLSLEIYAEAVRYCGNRAPTTPIQAQFSLSFGVAAALITGDLGPDAYRLLDDPALVRLEAMVAVVADPARTARGARLVATLGDGRLLAREAPSVPGDPETPMAASAVVAKFLRYAAPVIGRSHAERIVARLCDGDVDRPATGLLD